jgi:hypothetical protein
MKNNRKTRFIFKLSLLLYNLENTIWERYSHAFMKLNGGKQFHEYYQQLPDMDDIPF